MFMCSDDIPPESKCYDFQPSAQDAYAHNRLQLFGLLVVTGSKNNVAVKFVKTVMMGNIKEKNLQQAKFN